MMIKSKSPSKSWLSDHDEKGWPSWVSFILGKNVAGERTSLPNGSKAEPSFGLVLQFDLKGRKEIFKKISK